MTQAPAATGADRRARAGRCRRADRSGCRAAATSRPRTPSSRRTSPRSPAKFPAASSRCAIRDHAVVAAGDVLVRLDPAPYQLALAKAEAEIDSARAAVEQLKVSLREIRAEAKEAENKLSYLADAGQAAARSVRTRRDFGRAGSSRPTARSRKARDRVAVLHQRIARVEAALGGKPDRPTDAICRRPREAGAARSRGARSRLYRDQGAARRRRRQFQAPARRAGQGADAAVRDGRRPPALARGQFQGDRPDPRHGRAEGDGRARHASRHHLGCRGGKHQPGDRRRVRDPAGAECLAATG